MGYNQQSVISKVQSAKFNQQSVINKIKMLKESNPSKPRKQQEKETEVKSAVYSIVMFATYFLCYMLMQADIPSIPFAVGVIAFSILYSVVALILAYRLAPKTFKIRQ